MTAKHLPPGSILLIVVLLCGLLPAMSARAEEPVRVGVLAYRGKAQAIARWSPLAEYLSWGVSRRFEIVPLDLDEISEAVRSRDIEFSLTNPGNYVDLENRFGVSRIATMQSIDKGLVRERFGAVIVTRADNLNINRLEDLRGRSFMAVSPEAFGGFQMAWRELVEHNINPFTDFSELKFVGFPQDRIIRAVHTGMVDAATVRAETLLGMIENGEVRLHEFRILNTRLHPQVSQDRAYPLSTRLYPEWPFATLKHTPRELAAAVTQALLAMPADHPAARSARIAGWTVPLDYSPVNELMRSLQIGPYEVLRRNSLWAVMKDHIYWFLAAGLSLVFLLLLNGYVSRTNHRLKETERDLREEIEQRQRSQAALARYRDTLEEQVAARTEDLRATNLALEKSRVALRELVEITSAPELSHDQKVLRLLDNGRAYYGLPVAVLAGIGAEQPAVCKISGDRSLLPPLNGPLNQRCVSQILEQAGEPLDIPSLRDALGDDSECLKYGWNSYLGTTVLVDGRVCCTLEFVGTDARQQQLSKWDMDLLKVMAQWIGDELERQMAYEAQQKHQAELAHVSRMSTIGEMAASLAHELNQPLTGAINYSSACLRLLRDGEEDREKVVQGMERAVEGANLAADIIRHIREFVQKGDTVRAPVNLNQVVTSVVSLMNFEARRHAVIVETRLQEPMALVEGNMIQLEQVILNLVRNAIDAMDRTRDDKRRLLIVTEQRADGVTVRVCDKGEGIAEDSLQQIFDAFYTTKPDGMGIGLSISRSIIESHHGSIKAHNLSAGGAEFSFRLPLVAT
jgi:C4-dicarboxylate-specific signal transduction histidine kinase